MAAAPASATVPLVAFLLDGRRHAVELARVERVLRMVALTPLPQAPAVVLGVFDLAGQLVPAMDVRRRFCLPERRPRTGDQLLILRTPRRRVAFVVDTVEPPLTIRESELAAPGGVVPGLEHLRGLAHLPELGIVLVHDIDAFLSLDEAARLEAALEERA